jgi:hypothetical protein
MSRLMTVLAICVACSSALANDGDHVFTRDLGDDRAIAGGDISQMQPVRGDLLAAGGSVDVLAEVAGQALLAAGTLHVDAPVRQGLLAAGGRVSIAAPVMRNVRLAGGHVEISPTARISGNVSVAGGEIRVLGPLEGYLVAGAGRVLIDAPVAGDVDVRAGRVELGPHAVIGGRLRYASRDDLVRDPAAQVKGGIERAPWAAPGVERHHTGVVGWIWLLGLMLLAAALAATLPRACGAVAVTLAERPAASWLAGFAALVCAPVLAVVLLVTILGAPVGLLVLLAYPTLLLLGYASLAASGGRIVLGRFRPERQGAQAWQVLAAAVGMAVIGLAGRVPVVGGLVVLFALSWGVGSMLLAARRALWPDAGASAARLTVTP